MTTKTREFFFQHNFSMLNRPGFVILVAVLLSGCSTSLKLHLPLSHTPSDVLMFGKTPEHRFADTSAFTFPLSVVWEYDASAGFGSGSPIIVGNALIIGTLQGELHAVDMETGKNINSTKTYAPVSCSPAVYKKYLIVGTESINDNLLWIDTDNGGIEWSRNIGGVVASPIIKDSLLFAGGLDGRFYCFQAGFDAKNWSFDTGSPIRSSPCAWKDLVYCANSNGTVFAFDIDSGILRWKFGTHNAVFASLTVSDGKLFVASRDSNLYIIDGQSGVIDKKIFIGDKMMAAPAIDQGTVFIPSLDGALYAFSISDGSLLWKFQSKNAINTSPIVTPAAIFVASLDHHLYAVSRIDGREMWNHDFNSRIKTTPLVRNNAIFIAAEDKNVYLLR